MKTAIRLLLLLGCLSLVARAAYNGRDWLYDWLTDWTAWAVAALVFLLLEYLKQRRRGDL